MRRTQEKRENGIHLREENKIYNTGEGVKDSNLPYGLWYLLW